MKMVGSNDHLFLYLFGKLIIMLKDLLLKNRSYRRFYQDYEISINDLKDLVELAACRTYLLSFHFQN